MDFKGRRDKAALIVAREAISPTQLFRIPFHGVGELNRQLFFNIGDVDSSARLRICKESNEDEKINRECIQIAIIPRPQLIIEF